jgi:hypothetical protein
MYRLAALCAYLGEYESTLNVLRRAQRARYNLIGPRSAFWVEQEVREIKQSSGEKRARAWARLTMRTAEILQHGTPSAQTELLEIEKDELLSDHYESDAPVSARIVRELLETRGAI